MTRIKICGVTRSDDAARVAAMAVDFIGLNFWPRSKRYVAPERASELAVAARAAGPAKLVGVFVDTDAAEVAAILAHVELDIIQLHGDESAAQLAAIATLRPIWKVVAARDLAAVAELSPADAILLDTPSPERGGTGQPFDWSIARAARALHPSRLLVLAGGLRPDNVAAAIAEVEPWGVDVASGVESAPGIKDPAKLAAFVAAVRTRNR